MARHNARGKKGELLAASYLKELGFIILHVNWRHSHYEIDIIAAHDERLHIVEVKTRYTTTFGYPEEGVSKKKFKNLMNGVEEFLFQHPEWKNIQYDILSITCLKNKPVEFYLIEDVYL